MLYYDPAQPTSFSSRSKLEPALLKKGNPEGLIDDCLLQQESYTLHTPALKTFPRIPYTVNKWATLWEPELADMGSLSLHNGRYSTYVTRLTPSPSTPSLCQPNPKTCEALATAFRSISNKAGRRKPMAVRSDREKEFVNSIFLKLLNYEGK